MNINSDLREEQFSIVLLDKLIQIKAFFKNRYLIHLSLSLVADAPQNRDHPLGNKLLNLLKGRKSELKQIVYNLHGTPFQLKVWHETMKIPHGTTVTYGHIANAIGCGSPRAVGQALNKNPLPIIVPCHRVIGKNGKLTGFSSGLHIKKLLLLTEQNFCAQ